MSDFAYHKPFPLATDPTEYRLVTDEGVETAEFEGCTILKVSAEALTRLANEAIHDISFMLRPGHLAQVAAILDDAEATENDRMVALTLLRNAEIAARGILPMCQDTGTAIVIGKKGQQVWTGGGDEEALARGVWKTYDEENLRYSQMAPVTFFEEKNTRNNLPAQIELYATEGDAYEFLFITKGGGSANKTYLYQETKALLTPERFVDWALARMATLGTSACPPYHMAFVVGGTSAEATLKTVKLASTRYYDELPTEGSERAQAFRDVEMEKILLEKAREVGIGAQFGGKYFALDVRVIRLPRHGASCPVGLGVSCSADRQARAKITKDGVFLEKLETNPGRFIPDKWRDHQFQGVPVDLNLGMEKTLETLSRYPVTTALELTGTIIVARDIAHARLREKIENGEELPDYFKQYPVYYAGPAKKPEGMASGSFGPTTAGRMDPYVELFQAHGASMVMIAKGNRSQQVTDSCRKHGGFYLGSIGGPAAILAQNHIRKVEVQDFEELGMEAVWKIEVEKFPAFILVDDKGNDFFRDLNGCPAGLSKQTRRILTTINDRAIRLERPGCFETVSDPLGGLGEHRSRVAIRRIGVCGTDIHAFHGRQPFFEYPRILGHELAGEVLESRGDEAPPPGTVVAIEPYLNDPGSPASRKGRSNCCESLEVLGVHLDGGMRHVLDVPNRLLHPGGTVAPDALALVEMLGIGRHAVNRSAVTSGELGLVVGAGPIGLAVLSFLRLATDSVIVADIDERRLAFCRESLGVERTLRIDPGREFGRDLREACGGGLPELLFDATGNRDSMLASFTRVASGGRIVFVGLFQGDVTFSDPEFHRREITLLASRNATSREFASVIGSIAKGEIDTDPWITHRLALPDVPAIFPGTIASPDLRKAIIECEG